MAIILCFALTACVEDNPNSNIPGKQPTEPQPTEPEIKYAAEFRGEWINIHNGDNWYINGSTIKVNDTASSLNYTLARTSENVITAAAGAQKYTLFASRVADASFKAEVKLLDGDTAGTRNVDDGIPSVKITNPSQPDLPPIIIEPEADGTITVPNQIPGDKIEIVPVSSVWNNIKVELTPGYGVNQDMGVIPLTNGDNFKVSIKLNDTNADINELYADEAARNYIIEIENIGKTNSGEIGIEKLVWKESDYSMSSATQNFPNIAPGTKKQINVSIASKRIEYYESANRSIKINLINYDSVSKQVRRWTDTVSVNFYSEPVSINIKSETQVQGVIKGKRGKSFHFKTARTGSAGDFAATVEVPWSEDEYRIAFLGADVEAETATKYSFAINGEPPSDWQSLNMWDFLSEYKPHNEYEATAPVIDLSQGENSFMGYLAGDSIDYYKIKLGALSEIRQRTVSFNLNGGSGTVPASSITEDKNAVIQIPGQGDIEKEDCLFGGWNTKADGTGTNYDVEAFYTLSGNVTLYARWLESITSTKGIELVAIPAGTFTMGSQTIEPDRRTDEGPQRQVTLNGFYMGKYEVTQAQWTAVMGSLPSLIASSSTYGRGDNYPVYYVRWYDVIVFCNKLSIMEELTPAYRINNSTNPADWGTVPTSNNATWNAVTIVSGSTGYRLPTEAQWEYACRAGTTTAYNTGTGITTAQARFGAYSTSTSTITVGSFAANAWGLYDMHGNVWEFCWDWYGSSYYGESGNTNNPVGHASGDVRVRRGGSWYGAAERSASRNSYFPNFRDDDIGFRVVRP